MAAASRFVFLSDLHLRPAGVGPPMRAQYYDHLLHDFLGWLRASDGVSGSRSHLVLLGDVFELSDPAAWQGIEAPTVLHRIARLARDHPVVIASLARHLDAGWPVTVVPGNHDQGFIRADAQAVLTTLLSTAAGGPVARLSFSPWIFHVPGLIYAEHGHQYHDINTSSALLTAGADTRHDLVCVLQRFRERLLDGHPGAARRAAALVRAGLDLTVSMARSRTSDARRRRLDYRERVVAPHAAEVRLDAPTACALDALADVPPARTLRRLTRKAVRAARGQPIEHDEYLLAAARSVHGVLSAAGQGVPYYVFGHTHRAARRPLGQLPRGGEAVYLNTGAWSAVRRGEQLPESLSPASYVEVRFAADGRLYGESLQWPMQGRPGRHAGDTPTRGGVECLA